MNIEEIAQKAREMEPYPCDLFPPSLYYRFLRVLSEEHSPLLSVELGVCGGGGSLHLALGSKGKVIGIDHTNDHPDHIAYIYNHCPNFEFLIGDTIQSAPLVFTKYGKVDILFIDSVHTYEHAMNEYKAWKPFLNKDAIICLDDLFRERMEKVWEEIPGKKYRLDDLHLGGSETDGGFGIIFI